MLIGTVLYFRSRMTAQTHLQTLLASMEPKLQPENYVFCTLSSEKRRTISLQPVCEFIEEEGVTLILQREQAEKEALPFQYPCRMITLTIHSSLEAVGFLAAICTRLAAHGISVNPVSAYYHDHLFVPADRAEETVRLLKDLAAQNIVS